MWFASSSDQDFLLKGIAIANDCDLKYKVSQNQRYLLNSVNATCLYQL
jgi:DNA polymerase-3 subunit gamma/tau